METYDRNLEKGNEPKTERIRRGGGHVWGGMVLLIVGGVLLAREMNVDFPRWIFSWPMLLIAVGVYIGARHSFRSWGWVIPILIGTAFLSDRIFYDLNFRHFIWPAIIIGIGLFMIFRPRRRNPWNPGRWDQFQAPATGNLNDAHVLDIVSIFGGTKENILSKNFRGGDVVTFFGGTELNLMQADIQGAVTLDVTQVFGGTKLIVPGNWMVKSELVSIFGGVDDKRNIQPAIDHNKTLVLQGTCVFGGLEIKSF